MALACFRFARPSPRCSGMYGGLAALWAVVLLRWRLARLSAYELPVLTATTAAAMLVLGMRWDRTDAIGISIPLGRVGWIEHFAVLVTVGVVGGLAVRRRLTT